MTIARILRRETPAATNVELHPNAVLNRVFAARGITDPTDLDPSLGLLLPPDSLGDIGKATARLREALERGESITVVGDFDADGATSTALAVSALGAMGARQVHYLIPTRTTDGYGLSPSLVDSAAASGSTLIVTVDNGIAAHRGIERASSVDVDVIVTDHHLPGDELPEAFATVNPNVQTDRFPSKHLAGVGVTFYVMVALRSELRRVGWFDNRGIPCPRLADWLDLVAVGTVADLVPLDSNNRRLVEQGLRRIRAGQCRPGISALIAFGRRPQTDVVASDLAFSVAPRLNAAGRLDDMAHGVDCLLAVDDATARELAQTLDNLNQERRVIESQMRDSADLAVQKLTASGKTLPAALSLHHPDWHPGVVGILAGRIKDRHHRPTVAFAAADHGKLVGSARSVPELHIRDTIAEIAHANPDLIERFGGHAMAAGLTISAARLGTFEALFADVCAQHLGDKADVKTVMSDGPLAADDFSLELARLLRFAAPWGQAFAEPQFDGEFTVLRSRVVGERHLQLELQGAHGGGGHSAIAFGQAALRGATQVRLVYRLEINHWRGRDSVQLNVLHIEVMA
ncbi:MAG: single-stranded-DNA-specific exonuclease RecJ [Pseudomonadota bacterium]